MRRNFWHGVAQALRVLRRHEAGNLQDSGQTNQQLHIAYQPFFFPDRRQQFLLHVDDDESALLGLQRTARHLGVVGRLG
jgi:hypothetical protein